MAPGGCYTDWPIVFYCLEGTTMNDFSPPKPKRRWCQFSLRTLLLVLTGASICLACWRTGGIPVLAGTLLGVFLACGVGLVVGRITHRGRMPLIGALIGVLVAHVATIHVYYIMPYTDIRNWSIMEYLFSAVFGAVSGATVGAQRSANVVWSLGVGAVVGGLVAISVVSIILLATRYDELVRDPERFLTTAMVFIRVPGGLGLAIGGATGCLTGLVRCWKDIRHRTIP